MGLDAYLLAKLGRSDLTDLRELEQDFFGVICWYEKCPAFLKSVLHIQNRLYLSIYFIK